MTPSVYIETTIRSFDHETCSDPDMVARHEWTRDWWDNHRLNYELFTSDAVIDELERGAFPIKDNAFAMIEKLSLLNIDQAIADTVTVYILHHIMPADPAGDALH